MSNPTTKQFSSPQSLETVAQDLPEAEDTEIFWDDPADEFSFQGKTEIESHKAVYNPATGEMYNVVTDDYEIINPETFMLPLVEQIRERDRTDVAGFVNVYDGGGYGYGEILFDTDAIYPPDRDRNDEPVRTGLSLRYSHDGGMSVRAAGFAQDGMCKNTMHRVTDAVYVKHAGHVADRVDWNEEWEGVLSQLGVFSERLAAVIEEAIAFEMFDLRDSPFNDEWVAGTDPNDGIEEVNAPPGVSQHYLRGIHAFYDYLGLPNYLSLSATDRLAFRLLKSEEQQVVTAWDAYSAATYALSHAARFEAGSSSYDDYHRIASDILANPVLALERAEGGFRDRTTPDQETDPFAIDATVGEALEQYEEREKQIRTALAGE